MGKKRLFSIRGEADTESLTSRIKEAALDLNDKKYDMATLKLRKGYYKRRWAKELGTDPDGDLVNDTGILIAIHDNPQVHLEWLLADPRNQKALRDPIQRRAFLGTLTPEEREMYYHGPDGKGGYTDLEEPMGRQTRKNARRIVKRMVKRRTESAAFDSIDGDDADGDEDSDEDDVSEPLDGTKQQ